MERISAQEYVKRYGADALNAFKNPINPTAPSLTERLGAVGNDAASGISSRIQGTGEFADQSPIKRGTEAVAIASSVPVKGAYEMLPEGARSTLKTAGDAVQNGFRFLVDKTASTKLFSEIGRLEAGGYINKDTAPELYAVKEALSTMSAGGEIAGNILAAGGASNTLNAGKNLATNTSRAINTNISKGTEAVLSATSELPSKAKSWVQTPLKANVETVLKETPVERFDQYVQIARNATANNKNQTPLEFAGTRAQNALDQIDRKLSTIGSNKSAVLKSADGRKPVGNIVLKFRQDLQNSLKSKTSVEGDAKIYRDVLTEAERLGNNPTASQVDQFIDFVQDRIYTGKRDLTVPVTDAPSQILRPITGRLNEALKNKLPTSYRTLNQQYSDLVGMRNELNLKLGVEGEKGGALLKRVFSPSDANTKKLFADVLDETGIDLVNEATLARFLMDVLGDARQKSMLEQLNLSITAPSMSSATGRLIDYVVQKLNSPDEMIRRTRSQTRGGAGASP